MSEEASKNVLVFLRGIYVQDKKNKEELEDAINRLQRTVVAFMGLLYWFTVAGGVIIFLDRAFSERNGAIYQILVVVLVLGSCAVWMIMGNYINGKKKDQNGA